MNLADVMAKAKPMSVPSDLEMVRHFVQYLRPKTVLEFGIGAGGWALCVNHFVSGMTIVGVDNFHYDYGLGWPQTEAALRLYVEAIAAELGDTIDLRFVDLDARESLALDRMVDVVRVDCLDNMADIARLIDGILPMVGPRGVFFVDDIAPRICPGRFLAFIEQTVLGNLFPVWFGHKEGLWCRSEAHRDELHASLAERGDGHFQVVELYGIAHRVFLTDA
jgi:hypothetical protein